MYSLESPVSPSHQLSKSAGQRALYRLLLSVLVAATALSGTVVLLRQTRAAAANRALNQSPVAVVSAASFESAPVAPDARRAVHIGLHLVARD